MKPNETVKTKKEKVGCLVTADVFEYYRKIAYDNRTSISDLVHQAVIADYNRRTAPTKETPVTKKK